MRRTSGPLYSTQHPRKLLLLLGKGIVIIGHTQIPCGVYFGVHQSRQGTAFLATVPQLFGLGGMFSSRSLEHASRPHKLAHVSERVQHSFKHAPDRAARKLAAEALSERIWDFWFQAW